MPKAEREQVLQAELAELDEQRREAKGALDRERLTRITADLIQTITSPAFVERMQVARKQADEGAGYDAAAELLSIGALRRTGVDLPEDFRMTSRVFEDRVENRRFEISDLPVFDDELAPPAWGACGGAGGLTFCGCAGGGT